MSRKLLERWMIKVCLVLFCLGCVDEVPLEAPELNERKITIQGKVIAGDPSIIEVSVSRSADFINFFETTPIDNAIVQIEQDNGAAITIPETKSGSYNLLYENGDVSFETNNTYKLIVQIGESRYESAFEVLPPLPKIETINSRLEIRKELNEVEQIVDKAYIVADLNTSLLGPDSDQKAYFKWDFEGVYKFQEAPIDGPFQEQRICYVSDLPSLDVITVYNGSESSKNDLENFPIWEEAVEAKFMLAYYLITYQQVLSEGAYEYWNKVSQVIRREAALFEPPPGKILSNIKNINIEEEEVLGYFYVTQQDTFRHLVKGDLADFPSGNCGLDRYPTRADAPDYCIDCRLWPNSTREVPSWWIE